MVTRSYIRQVHVRDEGHATPLPALLVSAAGMVVLGIGAATDSDGLTILGGIAGGIGAIVHEVVRHMKVDYDVYRRLEKLEKK